MREFQAGQFTYRAGKLNAFDQLILVKILAGNIKSIITPDIVEFVAKSWEAFSKGEKPNLTDMDILSLFVPFANAVGQMSETDFRKIVDMSFSVVQRQQGETWSSIQANGILMFQDISAAQMVKITFETLVENLGGFFGELPSILGRGEKKPVTHT